MDESGDEFFDAAEDVTTPVAAEPAPPAARVRCPRMSPLA